MPVNKTKSPLAKKYGKKSVVRARNIMETKMGYKPGSEKGGKNIPWGVVGKIVQNEKKAHKNVTEKDIKKAKKNYKKRGEEKSLKRYHKELHVKRLGK